MSDIVAIADVLPDLDMRALEAAHTCHCWPDRECCCDADERVLRVCREVRRLRANGLLLLEALKRAHLVTCPTVDPIYHTCGGCHVSEVIAKAEGRS